MARIESVAMEDGSQRSITNGRRVTVGVLLAYGGWDESPGLVIRWKDVHIRDQMEPGNLAGIVASLMAVIFVSAGIASIFTGKIFMKNRGFPLDRTDGVVRFHACILFQFIFGGVLLYAAYCWMDFSS